MAVGRELFKLWGVIGTQGVDQTKAELKSIDRQVRKTQKEFERLGRRVAATGKVLTKALTLPLLAVGAAVGKFRADFDQAMTESTAIMGELSDAMRNDLKKAAIEVSRVTSFSAKQAAEAYFFLASAGLSAKQSIAALPQVARFAQAGNFELALATDLLTDAQSALGLTSKDTATNIQNMARVSDVLVKANTLANASVAQFSESLTNKAGAALRMLGKDVEEGAAVLAVFADQGLKGAAAGESLNIVMRDLQRASLENEDTFKTANVAVFDASGEMRNMADIVGDLDKLLLGMSDKQKRATLSMLGFQDKSISATMALLGTSEAIRRYETGLRDAAGTTDEVANKQLQTFWKHLGLLKDRLIAVGLTTETVAGIGNKVLIPMLEAVVKAAEAVNDWFNSLDPSMQKTVKGFIVLAAAIGPAVFLLGKIIALSKLLIPVLVAVKGGVAGLTLGFANLQKSMMFWTVLIGSVIALGWYWYSQWDSLSSRLKVVWANIEMMFLKGGSAVMFAMADMVIGIIKAMSTVGDFIPGVSEKLKGATIAMLEFKAAIYKDLGKQAQVVNNLRDQVKESKSLIDVAKEAKDQIAEGLGLKEKDIELTQKQIDLAEQKGNIDLAAEEKKKKLLEDRQAFELNMGQKVAELKLSEQEKLQLAFEQDLQRAEELGASKFNVVQFYAIKEQELKDQIRQEEAAKEKAALQNKFSTASNLGGRLNNVLAKFSDNRLKRLDISEQKEIAAIKNSKMTEEEKEAAIQKVQEKTDKKRRQIQRQAAMREKIAALFQIGINTASAIVEALPNIPLSIAVGLMGGAEALAVASTPLPPLEEGGLVKGTREGFNANIAENNKDEIVFPLSDGIDLLINGLIEKVKALEFPAFAPPQPALAGGGTVNLNIGTFIGDERGIKELERRLNTVRIAENQRKGFI